MISADQLAALCERLEAVVLQLQRVMPSDAGDHLTLADRAALAQLLPVMWAACGVSRFKLAELLAVARERPDLAAAIEVATGRPAPASAKPLGKLFRRALGATVDGLQVHRIGEASGVALWGLGYVPTTDVGMPGERKPTKPSPALP